jgi:hypothetical protein
VFEDSYLRAADSIAWTTTPETRVLPLGRDSWLQRHAVRKKNEKKKQTADDKEHTTMPLAPVLPVKNQNIAQQVQVFDLA